MKKRMFLDDEGHLYESTVWQEYKYYFLWGAIIVALFALAMVPYFTR